MLLIILINPALLRSRAEDLFSGTVVRPDFPENKPSLFEDYGEYWT